MREGMVPQIVPGPRTRDVVYTGQLSGAGTVTNTTREEGPSYAFVHRQGDVVASSYLPPAPCKCGARNPDNRCVSGVEETMPFEATTAASHSYMASLWDARPYMLVTPTDQATMLRAAPLPFQSQSYGLLGV